MGMAFELTEDEWGWLEQYDGLDLDFPAPPEYVRQKLQSLGLIKPKAAGLGLTPQGRTTLRSRNAVR
jgi:hypothetical protein